MRRDSSLLGAGAPLALVGVVACFGACSSPTTGSGFDPNEDGASSGGNTSSSGGFGGGDDAGTSTSGDDCSEEAKLVYVLSLEGDLYSFAPADKKFTKIGPLNCKKGSTQFIPISMAVDRNAVAWVNMRDASGDDVVDTMFKVDTKTAACTVSPITGIMGGMGFSTNGANSAEDTLYVVGYNDATQSEALVRVDFNANKFVIVKDFVDEVDMELTGTGDGRLYGFLQSSPLQLAAIDKKSTAFSNKVSLSKIQKPEAPMFAFSFWGGDFYFYTATDFTAAKTTTVAKYSPNGGALDAAYMTNIGFHIVGAGVSTCAPTTSPR